MKIKTNRNYNSLTIPFAENSKVILSGKIVKSLDYYQKSIAVLKINYI